MTTIAYDFTDNKIAVDGRRTTGNIIDTDSTQKWVRDGEDFWFLCGTVSDFSRFIEYMTQVDPDKPKFPIDCCGYLVTGSIVYHCCIDADTGTPYKTEITYTDALGSGGHFAIAAMDHGKSAKDAVKYAATRDKNTGGDIMVFDVSRMKII